jgi:hypothetical protein
VRNQLASEDPHAGAQRDGPLVEGEDELLEVPLVLFFFFVCMYLLTIGQAPNVLRQILNK